MGSQNVATDTFAITTTATLEIAKSGMPDPVIAGEMLLYQVLVTNTGPSVAYDVVVTDTLPVTGVVYAEASPVCSLVADQVICNLGNMQVGDRRSVLVSVRVDDSLLAGSTLTNTAGATASNSFFITTSITTTVNQSSLNPTDSSN